MLDDVELRYSNWMAQLISVMMPWSLYWVAGRASAKTVQVLAERVQEVAHDCPGCAVCMGVGYLFGFAQEYHPLSY